MVQAVYRCRRCGAEYRVGEFDAGNLSVCQLPAGRYQGERIPPSPAAPPLVDIHDCDQGRGVYGVGDLIGWEP